MERLSFGIGPVALGDGGAALRERFAKLLARALGVRVTLITARSYNRLFKRCMEGEVDLAWLPPAVFVRVKDAKDTTQLLLGSERKRAEHYHGAIFVRGSSDIQTPEDLADTVIAWVDPSSSAGFLFPRFALLSRGLIPDSLFAEEQFARSHEAVVRAVEQGAVDAGATYVHLEGEGASAKIVASGFSDLGAPDMRVVLTSRSIPVDVVASMIRLPGDLEKKVIDTLAHLHERPEAKEILDDLLQVKRFAPVSLKDYEIVRAALNVAHLPILGTDD
jgi:phosphate/phosphite/phosphonate ABC transporter binding protein